MFSLPWRNEWSRGCGYIFGAKVDSTPSQVECSIVGTLHVQKDVEALNVGYFQTIYRLMLAGF